LDPFTHLLLTRALVGRDAATLFASAAPDMPWYVFYPTRMARPGRLKYVLETGDWPDPPGWVLLLHNAGHSLLVLAGLALLIRLLRGRWPGRWIFAWLLHILVDIPSHTPEDWGPPCLWPLSGTVVRGVSWVETARSLAFSPNTRSQPPDPPSAAADPENS
jgi:hypothetical protein